MNNFGRAVLAVGLSAVMTFTGPECFFQSGVEPVSVYAAEEKACLLYTSGYRGPKAASEKEVQALVKWVNRIERRGKIAGVVSYHSTGSILYGRCASRATKKVRNITTRMYKLAKSLTTVSYTHLDVYKRQLMMWAELTCEAIIFTIFQNHNMMDEDYIS